MFSHIDDLLQMREQDEYTLIHEDTDLIKVFHQLNTAGYRPQIKYQGGQLTNIYCKFYDRNTKKSMKYNITSQNLCKDEMEEDILTHSEEEYNKITATMFKLQKAMFKENHLSYYNEIDVEILKQCKSIVPSGRFYKNISLNTVEEIDINKAFTHAGCQINYIPKFTQFDIFEPYDNNVDRLHNLTLYIVEVEKANIFFNKKILFMLWHVFKTVATTWFKM